MIWRFGNFRLDPDGFELARDGETAQLEPQVLALLIHLVRHRERMVTKDEIVQAVWNGRAVSDASIASRIRSARQAVDDDGERQTIIRTIHGRGFRFVADVTETLPAPLEAVAPQVGPDTAERSRVSIAVLPFHPLGLAPDLAILADAIPHEIIQALSRMR
ncbi:MAG: winged helix-turn-helix domain-containing protein, partial [Haliea sp.]